MIWVIAAAGYVLVAMAVTYLVTLFNLHDLCPKTDQVLAGMTWPLLPVYLAFGAAGWAYNKATWRRIRWEGARRDREWKDKFEAEKVKK